MYDLIIKNGRIINGTGSPSFYADVAIKDGKISAIAKNLGGGEKIIDAEGLAVTPGFIDSHSHSEGSMFWDNSHWSKVEQGITTSIAGQCGGSHAPYPCDIPPERIDNVPGFGPENEVFKTMSHMLSLAKDIPQGSNVAVLVGHGSCRRAVVGVENREPTEEELEKMKALLRDGLEAGALGMSLGLIYTPGCYAKTDELIEMAKVVAEYGGVVAAHIRDEGDLLAQAVAEFIKVIKAANVRGVLSHHKAATRSENWGKTSHTLRMIEQANEEGYEIYCDVYPYEASHTGLASTFLPGEFRAQSAEEQMRKLKDPKIRQELKDWNLKEWGEDVSWVQLALSDKYTQYKGMRLNKIAEAEGIDGYEMIFRIMEGNHMGGTAIYFTMCEDDICRVLKYPRTMIGTDGGVPNGKGFHPRNVGTFTRVLGRYVREKKVTSLPEMIRKMTSMPASVYGLKTKGLIWEGMDADICIFDPDKIADKSTFTDCSQKAEGLNYVLVGGEVVAENAVFNGKLKGKVILK